MVEIDIHASPGALTSALSSHVPNVCCRPLVAAWNSVTEAGGRAVDRGCVVVDRPEVTGGGP